MNEQFFHSNTEAIANLSEVAESRAHSEIQQYWDRHYNQLKGAVGIFCVSDEKFHKPDLPQDTQFGIGQLTSVLDGNKLMLIGLEGELKQFTYTYTISMDTNFCSYLLAFTKNTLDAYIRPGFVQSLDYLYNHLTSLDLVPYLYENARKDLSSLVDETVEAFCRYKSSDRAKFKVDQKFHLTCNESDITDQISTYREAIRTKEWDMLAEQGYRNYLTALIVLLIATEVYFRLGKKGARKQYSEILQRLHDDFGNFPQLELMAVQQLLISRNTNSFFRVVDKKSPKLLRSLKGMAWDLSHIRSILQSNARNSRIIKGHADFVIPYLITFDRGITSVIDCMKHNGIVYQQNGGNPKFVSIHRVDALLANGSLLTENARKLLEPHNRADRLTRCQMYHDLANLEEKAENFIDELKMQIAS